MNLTLHREVHTDKSTIGKLYIEESFICYVLEDVVRDVKIKHETAIPAGKYEVIISWSPRFQRQLPLLVGVPGFDGIRIHPGNTDKDTDGCLLPGTTQGVDFVGGSKIAFDKLYAKLLEAKDKIYITID